ncbi:epoxide hydrolase family protein [Frankia sp. AgB32]|uniref:epoxide hydrolase family protein n=1 Tax=Frankia sp. AgB32 TaxID=631119 RepID=UPI00200C162A|nr:epoxide hydrolase family protein [Frankia sp. AgB32]MCK9897309.1 epoxide hydrolase 1 [Frankia sp. AgB32]
MTETDIEPLHIAYSDQAIADLRERLRRTRWAGPAPVTDWSQGVPLAYLRELCGYWSDGYDFAAAQARLNAVPHFRTNLDGLGVHFIHVRSPHPAALPLVLTHGWPGSVVEFLGVIDALTDPADPRDAFDVVIPSLPGYGWSDTPAETGWGVARIARAWDELMGRLGYDRYGAQGGDWGAMVTTSLGRQRPDRVVGLHVNMPIVPFGQVPMTDLTASEQSALARAGEYATSGMGYSSQQSTRPQTLGYGLADSPAGQCAWILEKFREWTDCDGHPEKALTRDQMLDDISVYWFTGTATSSARLYWESFRDVDTGEVAVPSGVSVFPQELFRASRRWAEIRFTDLRWFGEPARGGHFAAFEQPAAFVEEVRGFFRHVR